jgi:hypothetical protein
MQVLDDMGGCISSGILLVRNSIETVNILVDPTGGQKVVRGAVNLAVSGMETLEAEFLGLEIIEEGE